MSKPHDIKKGGGKIRDFAASRGVWLVRSEKTEAKIRKQLGGPEALKQKVNEIIRKGSQVKTLRESAAKQVAKV